MTYKTFANIKTQRTFTPFQEPQATLWDTTLIYGPAVPLTIVNMS